MPYDIVLLSLTLGFYRLWFEAKSQGLHPIADELESLCEELTAYMRKQIELETTN